jgi:hypothetical protein
MAGNDGVTFALDGLETLAWRLYGDEAPAPTVCWFVAAPSGQTAEALIRRFGELNRELDRGGKRGYGASALGARARCSNLPSHPRLGVT